MDASTPHRTTPPTGSPASGSGPARGMAAALSLLLTLLLAVVPTLLLPGAPALAATRAERWQWPLSTPPPVVRRFERPPQRWAPGHRGVDLLSRTGAAVLAAGDGRVAFVGFVAGRPVVAVQHGLLRTTYEPVAASVTEGQRVSAGDVLGHLVGVGSHCPPRTCLHWGLKRGRDYLDPLTLVGRGPVRLLPLWGDAARPGVARIEAPSAASTSVAPPARANPPSGANRQTLGPAASGPGPGERPGPTLAAGALITGGTVVAGGALMQRRRRTVR